MSRLKQVIVVTQNYPYSETEQTIMKKAQLALRYALLCGTGLGAPLFVVLAFRAAAEATRLINETGQLEGLLPRLLAARLVAASITFSWLMVVCAISLLLLLASNAA